MKRPRANGLRTMRLLQAGLGGTTGASLGQTSRETREARHPVGQVYRLSPLWATAQLPACPTIEAALAVPRNVVRTIIVRTRAAAGNQMPIVGSRCLRREAPGRFGIAQHRVSCRRHWAGVRGRGTKPVRPRGSLVPSAGVTDGLQRAIGSWRSSVPPRRGTDRQPNRCVGDSQVG